MAQSFDLNIRYKMEDRALVRGLRQQLSEARKLESMMTKLKDSMKKLASASGSNAGAKKLAKDFDGVAKSIRSSKTEAERMIATLKRLGPTGRTAAAQMMGLPAVPQGPGNMRSTKPGSMAFLGRNMPGVVGGYAAYRVGKTVMSNFAGEDRAYAEARSLGASQSTLDRATKLANQYPRSRQEMAWGVKEAMSSNVKEKDAFAVVEQSAKLASTEYGIQVSDALSVLTGIANAQSKGGEGDYSPKNLQRISDVLAMTVDKGTLSMADLQANIGEPMSIAGIAGVSLEDVAATMGVLSLKGINGAEGSTAVKNLLGKIVNPTPDAEAFAKSIGVDLSQKALSTKGLPKVMQEVINASSKQNDPVRSLMELFPELRAAKAAMGVAGDPKMFEDFVGHTNNAGGATDRIRVAATQDVSSQFQMLKSQATDLALTAGTAIGAFEGITGALKALTSGAESLKGAMPMIFDEMHQKMVDFGILKDGTLTTKEKEAQRVSQESNQKVASLMKKGVPEAQARELANSPIPIKGSGPLGSWTKQDRETYSEQKKTNEAVVRTILMSPAQNNTWSGSKQGPSPAAGPSPVGPQVPGGAELQGAAAQQQSSAAALQGAAAALRGAAGALSAVKITANISNFVSGFTGSGGSGGVKSPASKAGAGYAGLIGRAFGRS